MTAPERRSEAISSDPAENDDGGEPMVVSAREAARRRAPGWPAPGEPYPGPPLPVPPGRSGDQIIPRPLHARPGRAAPWADLPADRRRPGAADVRRVLAEAGPPVRSGREQEPGIDRAAAVLAPLYEHHGELWVLLTRRTWDLRSHQGEVSFPGGRHEDQDLDLATTALRETEEEVAVAPDLVELVGELDHLATITSRSFIVPYVGLLPGRPHTVANPAEVSAVLHVPVAELLDPAHFREERWTFPGRPDQPIFFFELVGDTVWGATGAMLRQLLGLLTGTVRRGELDHL